MEMKNKYIWGDKGGGEVEELFYAYYQSHIMQIFTISE
jgi:hypothetical protein